MPNSNLGDAGVRPETPLVSLGIATMQAIDQAVRLVEFPTQTCCVPAVDEHSAGRRSTVVALDRLQSSGDVFDLSVKLPQQNSRLQQSCVIDHHAIVSSKLNHRALDSRKWPESELQIDGRRSSRHTFSVATSTEQIALAQLRERLASKYAELPPDRISAAVQDAHARFDASPIRDFVPLLVERRAREQLASRHGSHTPR